MLNSRAMEIEPQVNFLFITFSINSILIMKLKVIIITFIQKRHIWFNKNQEFVFSLDTF